MPVRKIEANGKTYHLGRKRPAPRGKLHLGDYATATLPPPPPSLDYSVKAGAAVMGAIFKNSNLGCCVVADNARFVGILTGNAGKTPFLYSDHQVIADYSAIGGYVAGDESTDDGCDPEAALQYYQDHGYADGSKLAAWYAIDATNELLVKQAIWLGGPIAVALDLLDRYVDPFPKSDGFVWDLAGPTDPNNGHEVIAYGYNSRGVLIDSWGMKGLLTWSALATYCTVRAGGNLYGRMDADILDLASKLAPNGFDWNQLLSDAQAMGGSPVIPPPSPSPVPPPPAPAPTPAPAPNPLSPLPFDPTWQQLIAWLIAVIQGGASPIVPPTHRAVLAISWGQILQIIQDYGPIVREITQAISAVNPRPHKD